MLRICVTVTDDSLHRRRVMFKQERCREQEQCRDWHRIVLSSSQRCHDKCVAKGFLVEVEEGI